MDSFYENIALGLFKSKYLLRVNNDLEEVKIINYSSFNFLQHLIPEISELMETRKFAITFLNLIQKKSNLPNVFRKEIIWDMVNTILQKDNNKNAFSYS